MYGNVLKVGHGAHIGERARGDGAAVFVVGAMQRRDGRVERVAREVAADVSHGPCGPGPADEQRADQAQHTGHREDEELGDHVVAMRPRVCGVVLSRAGSTSAARPVVSITRGAAEPTPANLRSGAAQRSAHTQTACQLLLLLNTSNARSGAARRSAHTRSACQLLLLLLNTSNARSAQHTAGGRSARLLNALDIECNVPVVCVCPAAPHEDGPYSAPYAAAAASRRAGCTSRALIDEASPVKA